MTGPIVEHDLEPVERTLAEEEPLRRDVLARLRRIVTDAQAVERRVLDDYERADVERRRAI